MRLMRLAAAVAALTLAAMPAVAGCCRDVTVYGIPPLVPLIPPPFAFDPSDPAAPLYIVDQGPVLSGPGIYTYHTYVPPFARPTYWGDYAVVDAYGTPFPYVHHALPPAYHPFGVAPTGAYPYWPVRPARFIRVR